jgi:3-hydroxymyristoyl/3-hydroxydecanoyl-(acyl carrier protein) dehydratase
MDKEVIRSAAKPILPQHADTLLPHQPPMLLVEALIERRESCAVARATLPITGLFVMGGRILPEYFIELIAQTAALGNCYDAFMSKMATRDGMLVGIDSFSWPGQSQPGTSVHIETDISFTFGSMKVVRGEVYSGKRLLAAGDIKVWEDLGNETKSSSQLSEVFHHASDGFSFPLGEQRMGRDDDSLYNALSGCCLELRLLNKEELRMECSTDCLFPAHFLGFQGHFPGNPILPAIVQLAMVRFITDRSLGFRTWPMLHQKIKFKGTIRPGDPVTVTIVLNKDGPKWGGIFSLKRPGGEAVSSGVVDFAF